MNVSDYFDTTQRVDGWFFPVDAHLFAIVDAMQKRMTIRGNLFEVGAHHGKTAIFLAKLASPNEILGVYDVFDQQELNVDGSGKGSRAIFDANIRKHAGAPNLRVFSKLSSDRFFHIDGGHRPQDVYADLTTADRALLEEGLVAIDEVFNPNWPGVSEGFIVFAERAGVFAPIAIGGNKVLFARPRMIQHYRITALLAEVPYTIHEKQWLGYSVPTAIRRAWVDLDPTKAAQLHFVPRTWRDRVRQRLL